MPTNAEIEANLTWYKLNSHAQDPMFRYMEKLAFEHVQNTYQQTNFESIDGNIIVDRSEILNYGSLPCSAGGKEAYMDSHFFCALFQLPYFLENLHFGYICYALIFPILAISIFGGIKESYRWFLLNQALWDSLVSYDFICEKPTALTWNFSYSLRPSCFYAQETSSPILRYLFGVIKDSLRQAPFAPLLLLAFSRYVSLYLPNFYKNYLSKTWICLTFILIFDLLFIGLASLRRILPPLLLAINSQRSKSCLESFCGTNPNQSVCYNTSKEYFQCYNRVALEHNNSLFITQYILIIIPPTMFFFGVLFAFLIILKISCQLKYQLKHNRTAFMKTIKIAAVISFQCLSLTGFFVTFSFQSYLQTIAMHQGDKSIYASLSPSIFLLQNYTSTTSFNIIRVFLDSLIVLTVLSGYQKWIFKFVMYVPRKSMSIVKSQIASRQSSVRILSASHTVTVKR